MEYMMKRIFLISLLALPALALGGCSSLKYNEKKAPCPPSASMSENPCNHIPINIAAISNSGKSKA